MANENIKVVAVIQRLWVAESGPKENRTKHFIHAVEIGHAHRAARKMFGARVSFSVREVNQYEMNFEQWANGSSNGDDPANWG